MNLLATDKRKQLAVVLLATAGALVGLYLGLINAQKQSLRHLAERKAATVRKLQEVKHAIDNAVQIETQLCQSRKRLEEIEEGMASGDLYSWAINTVRQFKLGYKVEIPQYSQIDGPKDNTLLAGFPYKQASVSIGGSAYYQDLGRFLADFENQFPYMRLLNLSLEPASGPTAADKEKLAFRIEIVALVKPTAS